MRYLVTFTKPGNDPFVTQNYDYDNNFDEEKGMQVFDLYKWLYTTNGVDWMDIPADHL